ncbi:hypothetical protein OG21DRAFT_277948 [Imleria badia]|nr:hypothetical protein OG21DRAFT_277948 [Imleria badia]
MEVAFTSSGASLSGALSSSTVTFGDVELRDGLMELTFWSSGRKKNVDIMLRGKLGVDFLGSTLGAVVHLYPGEGGVEWAIVADLNASSRPFDLSDAVPEVKGGFLDFSLKNAVFIAASKDDPPVSESFPGYRVRKGVQVFGIIEHIPALNDLLGEHVTGLVLSMGWSKASGFDLMIYLPAESTLHLGNGIRTTPITLGIRTNPVELTVIAGVTVPVKDSTPLDFNFLLAADIGGARASAQMEGWWVKPFGTDSLKIGPEVTLSIEIIHAQFVSTGTPSGFGIAGGLMIGSIQASLAMDVSEDPKRMYHRLSNEPAIDTLQRQMLCGELKNLDISDVVTFAGQLVQQDIPKISDGLLKFEELRLYIRPIGVVLGTTPYPAGFSFMADLLFLEKRANVQCTIDKAQKSLDIIGSIDNFELGPLSVRGSKGPRATLECHIGVSKQQLVIDGIVTLFDMKAQTYIDVQFLPKPKFKFYLLLQFASVFMFKLDAELLGSIHDRLSDADFSLYAELENVILEYISQQLIELFDAAEVAATQGLEVAQGKVEEAQKAREDAISGAEKNVEDAEKEWQSYERSFWSSSQSIIDRYLSEISRLRAEVDKARTDFNNARRTAERAVEQANQDRSATLATGRRAVENAKHDIDRSINSAQRQLDYAKADLSKEFGVVQRAIEGAHRAVWSLQTQINDVKRTIDDYERALGYEFWKKPAIPGLRVTVGRLDASKAFTNGVLDAARGILRGTEYLEKVAAVESARGNLEDARETGEASLSAARGVLIIADDASNRAANRAKNNLEGVRAGTEFTAFKTAAEALDQFQNVNRVAYEAAVGALEGSTESAAFIAFNSVKAGLEVAKESTQLLDAEIEALALVEKATQTTLSILQKVVKFGVRTVTMKTIILSGTLHGILGVNDSEARPLSATIQGYFMGNRFDIRAEFDPSKPVAFITTIFKQLWDLIYDTFTFSSDVMAASDVLRDSTENASASSYGPDLTYVGSLGFAGARSAFLERRPNVLGLLVNESELIAAHIPQGPFSGTPLFPSVAVTVARRALILMQEERRVSIFDDLDGILG